MLNIADLYRETLSCADKDIYITLFRKDRYNDRRFLMSAVKNKIQELLETGYRIDIKELEEDVEIIYWKEDKKMGEVCLRWEGKEESCVRKEPFGGKE